LIQERDRVTRLDPNFAAVRGVAKAALGRHKEAIADYDRAIELNPLFAEAYNRRSMAKNHLGPGSPT
jgi:tetratricopeptide (TPR) repeat protein